MPHSIRCHVTIYDCGGQPSDYTSHPAFSSPTAGYVVVCDARHPNPAPYLRFVATHAPTAPVLVVVAHIDETAGADQSVPHMCDDDTSLAYATPLPLLVSNKTGEGVDAIRATLASLVARSLLHSPAKLRRRATATRGHDEAVSPREGFRRRSATGAVADRGGRGDQKRQDDNANASASPNTNATAGCV